MNEDKFKKIVSHAKEFGFVFPSSEIYDGLSATYDYGQNGVELKNNIKKYWWKSMVQMNKDIVGLDAAIFMHPTTWKASGHVDAFNDPLIDNKDSKKRYRADVLLEDYISKIQDKNELTLKKIKSEGGDKDGSKENEVRKKFNNLMLSYGLGGTPEANGADPSVSKTLFKDKKLQRLWEKAEQAGLNTEELIALQEEFKHHQRKVDEYHALLEIAGDKDSKRYNEVKVKRQQEEQFTRKFL